MRRMRSKDMVGRVIGGFRIENLVGKGASGVVFRATQESVSRTVALKVLTSKWASDPTNLARFQREAIAAGRITHPNVVSVIEFGENAGLFYMAMTYVDGRSLSDILKNHGPPSIPFVARMGYQMASALEAIDQVGLVHRDIKPANIMIARADQAAYLTDLGLAKATDSSQDITMKGFTVGTPNYIAPEQAMAEEELTIACDLYSLGATLYHAATGELVFPGDNAFQVMKAHVKQIPRDPRELQSDMPGPMAELLLSLLEKAPGDRPTPSQTAASLKSIVMDVLHNTKPASSGRSRPRSRPAKSQKPVRASGERRAPDKRRSGERSAQRAAEPDAGSRSGSRDAARPANKSGSRKAKRASRTKRGTRREQRPKDKGREDKSHPETPGRSSSISLNQFLLIVALLLAIIIVLLVLLLI